MLRTTASILVLLLGCTGCGFPRNVEVSGLVLDKESGEPVPEAEVVAISRGWGRSGGSSVVWDKTYSDKASTDANGRFAFRHYGDAQPIICVRAAGYDILRLGGAAPGETIRIIRSAANVGTIIDKQLFLGTGADQSSLGWDFAAGDVAATEAADLILSSNPDLDRPITLKAPGGLYVENDLPASGHAPETGYRSSVTIDPLAKQSLYVRSRDGSRYARIDMGQGISLVSHPDGRRGLLMNYFYDPAGGRVLRKDIGDPCPSTA